MTPQKTDPDTPMSTQEFPVEVWVGSGLLQGRGTECSRECTNLLEEVAIISITSTIVWPQVKQQGGHTVLPINRKLD